MAQLRPAVDRLDEIVAHLRDVVDEVTSERERSHGDAAMLAAEWLPVLEQVGAARRLIDAVGVQVSGVLERSAHDAPSDSVPLMLGEKDATAVVALTAGIEPREARAWCVLGDRIGSRATLIGETLPAENEGVAAKLLSGELSVSASRLVSDSIHDLRTIVDPSVAQRLERDLVDRAAQFSTRELRRLCRELPDMFAPDDAELRERLLREKSGLTISRGRDGSTKWVLVMHPEAAGLLTAALDARTAPRRQPTFVDDAFPEIEDVDDRTLALRRLDALVSIAKESLRADPGKVGGTAVTMMVTVPLSVLTGGAGVGRIEGVDGPICASTARRLAAEADVIPLVLGTESQPLDLGRTARIFTEAQRRFIAARDGGCLWPNCDAPPGWCEIAHIVAWLLLGETNVANGILLCPFHHRRLDLDHWRFEWIEGVPYFTPPGWIDSARRPRRGGRAPAIAAASAHFRREVGAPAGLSSGAAPDARRPPRRTPCRSPSAPPP